MPARISAEKKFKGQGVSQGWVGIFWWGSAAKKKKLVVRASRWKIWTWRVNKHSQLNHFGRSLDLHTGMCMPSSSLVNRLIFQFTKSPIS